jgi:voltage-gated potassium channel
VPPVDSRSACRGRSVQAEARNLYPTSGEMSSRGGNPGPPERERAPSREESDQERETLQERISDWLDVPLALLSLVWTGLLVVELAFTLTPEASERTTQASLAIWFVFAVAFFFEFAIAPNKRRYLRRNFLAGISVVVPFARVVRVVRVVTLLRSISLVRIVLISNRATRALGQLLSEHQFQYVLALVTIITLIGAAGVYFFERDVPNTPFYSLGEALWWSATTVTTVNVGVDPATAEGRIVALLLRVVAVGVFGYVAGSVASYLVGQRPIVSGPLQDERDALLDLTDEVRRLRAAVERLEQGEQHDEGGDQKGGSEAA